MPNAKIPIRKLLAAAAFVLVLGTAGVVTAAGPATANSGTAAASSSALGGGGCIRWNRNGWNINACGSNQGTTGYVDFYVDGRPCSSCKLKVYTDWQGPGASNTTWNDDESPTFGHHGPWVAYLDGGWQARLHIVTNTGLDITGPWIWY